MGAGPHSSTRANSSVMSGEYYDVNDFLAREHAVTVEFVDGASSLGPEVVGKRTTHISNKPTTPNGDADGDDVPREHVARVPVWWLDGELCRDLFIEETCAREVFSDDVFNKLEAENGEPASASTIVEPRYRVFGDAAVVTYVRLQQRGRATTRTEETRVWRRCDPASDAALGRWRLVHFHRSAPSNAYG